MRERSDTLGPGDPAPPFALESARGGTVALDAFRGRSVALFFFRGTW